MPLQIVWCKSLQNPWYFQGDSFLPASTMGVRAFKIPGISREVVRTYFMPLGVRAFKIPGISRRKGTISWRCKSLQNPRYSHGQAGKCLIVCNMFRNKIGRGLSVEVHDRQQRIQTRLFRHNLLILAKEDYLLPRPFLSTFSVVFISEEGLATIP